MKKALLPLLIASVLPAAAMADVVVYGKAFVTFQNTDLKSGPSYTELVNNASRIGIKGSEAASDDWKAIYQFEYQTKPDDGSIANNYTCTAKSTSTTTAPAATTATTTTCTATGGQTFSQRNIFVGVQGVGGTVKLGMFDTPLKLAQEKIDLFNDLIGDLQAVLQGETRAKNVVQYSTPEMAHITGNLAYVNSETDATNTGNGYSASVVYNTKQVYFAIANDHNVTNAMNKTVFTKDTNILRAVGRFVAGPVTLGAMVETYDNGAVDENGFLVSGKYELSSEWALKAQYAKSDMIAKGGKTASLGVDYKFSKNTTLLGYYTNNKDELVKDDKYLGVGIEMNF